MKKIRTMRGKVTGSRQRLQNILSMAELCIFEIDFTKLGEILIENAELIFNEGEQVIKHVPQQNDNIDAVAYCMEVLELFATKEEVKRLKGTIEAVLKGEKRASEIQCQTARTPAKWCKLILQPIYRELQLVRVVGVLQNISDIKRQIRILEEAASRDTFTGLYNKKSSQSLIEACLIEEVDKQHALILIDLDNFKEVNDNYGHAIGDELLLDVANHLRSLFRKTDIVGRFGGDEYIVLMRDISSIESLKYKLGEMITGKDNKYDITKSIGVALYPEMGRDFQTLFRKADEALYESKIQRGIYTIYHE